MNLFRSSGRPAQTPYTLGRYADPGLVWLRGLLHEAAEQMNISGAAARSAIPTARA